MTVENLPVPAPVTTAELEQRRVKALEDQAAAMLRQAAATEALVRLQTQVAAPLLVNPKAERFERVVRTCVESRMATTVEGFLTFARELCDGIEREFPTPTAG